jgi:adenine-specific DNA-methyltransferase
MAKPPNKLTVETLRHTGDKRKNIPTAEHQSVIQKEQAAPRTVKYLRNTDLDPQLVWRGKDEQDWSDLVVHAPPLYIQEKVHPKVLIDDLLRHASTPLPLAGEGRGEGEQLTLFADFNGIPEGVDKTDFYQHDQNWSNRMILGDSLQVMASLAEREGQLKEAAVTGSVRAGLKPAPTAGTSATASSMSACRTSPSSPSPTARRSMSFGTSGRRSWSRCARI